MKNMFSTYFYLENGVTKKESKQLVYFDFQNVNSLLVPSLRHQLVLDLCFSIKL